MKQIKISTRITNRDSNLIDSYFNEISKYPTMTLEEEIETARLAREEGDEIAIQKLVKSNLRFAVSVAKMYQSTGSSLLDLINDANEGLMKAARKYDERKGNKFISYAVWWIRQSIMESLNKTSRAIRLPSNRFQDLSKINRFCDDFYKREGREATKEEICEGLNMEDHDYQFVMDANSPISSLNKPFSDDDSSTLEEVLPTESYGNVEENMLELSRKESVKKIFSILPEREADALKIDYGFGETYDSVSEKHGISKERVRQLKQRALILIRSKKGVRQLQDLL